MWALPSRRNGALLPGRRWALKKKTLLLVRPDPATVSLIVSAQEVYPDPQSSLKPVRHIPQTDPQREAAAARQQKLARDRTPRAWLEWGRKYVLTGFKTEDVEPFFHLVRHYGPRGLSLMLREEEILQYVESWWVGSLLGDKKSRRHLQRIGEELARAAARGNIPKLMKEESEQNQKDAEAINKAVRRLGSKFEKWLPLFKNKEDALRQAIEDYTKKPQRDSRLRNSVIRKFLKTFES